MQWKKNVLHLDDESFFIGITVWSFLKKLLSKFWLLRDANFKEALPLG